MAGNASTSINHEDTLTMSINFDNYQEKFAELFAAVFWEVNYRISAVYSSFVRMICAAVDTISPQGSLNSTSQLH